MGGGGGEQGGTDMYQVPVGLISQQDVNLE